MIRPLDVNLLDKEAPLKDRLVMAQIKRRFQDTYEYTKESVQRGSVCPVPSCFKSLDSDNSPFVGVPLQVIDLPQYALNTSDEDVISWLMAFDLKPMVEYCKMFGHGDYPYWDFVTDVEELTEYLKDFQAEVKYLHDRMIARNCAVVDDDFVADAAKEFAGTFMDGGETPENVQRAQTILAHMKTLGQTEIARYLGGREDVRDKPRAALHRWLKTRGYNVGSYQGFNAAFPNKKKVAKITINKQVL